MRQLCCIGEPGHGTLFHHERLACGKGLTGICGEGDLAGRAGDRALEIGDLRWTRHDEADILCGVGAGFLLYFLSNFVFALGLSAKIPVILAGWAPAGVSLMLGTAMLLHLEDG